jgi:methylated-DNA-[protein]-cysteine S-methyltransferase
VASEQGLVCLEPEEQVVEGRFSRWERDGIRVRWSENQHTRQAALELDEYFACQRQEFTVPVDLRGTLFQRGVWAALQAIPYGQTRSYGQVALALGRPTAGRAVGAANGRNPVSIIVPCHRVIGAGGALVGYGGGLHRKSALLELEARPPG